MWTYLVNTETSNNITPHQLKKILELRQHKSKGSPKIEVNYIIQNAKTVMCCRIHVFTCCNAQGKKEFIFKTQISLMSCYISSFINNSDIKMLLLKRRINIPKRGNKGIKIAID